MKHTSWTFAAVCCIFIFSSVTLPAEEAPNPGSAIPAIGGTEKDVAFYVCGDSDAIPNGFTRLGGVFQFPGGGILLGGVTTDTSWFPGSAKQMEVPFPVAENAPSSERSDSPSAVPFLLILSSKTLSVHSVIRFPADSLESVDRIVSPALPGKWSDTLYVSGRTAKGYSIICLDVSSLRKRSGAESRQISCRWTIPLSAAGVIQAVQPWDVDSSGRVFLCGGKSVQLRLDCGRGVRRERETDGNPQMANPLAGRRFGI